MGYTCSFTDTVKNWLKESIALCDQLMSGSTKNNLNVQYATAMSDLDMVLEDVMDAGRYRFFVGKR